MGQIAAALEVWVGSGPGGAAQVKVKVAARRRARWWQVRQRSQDLRLTVTQLDAPPLRPHAAARQEPNAHTASQIPRNSSPSSGNHAYLSYVIGSRSPGGQEATAGAAVPLGARPSGPERTEVVSGRDGRPPGLQRRLLCHSSPQG